MIVWPNGRENKWDMWRGKTTEIGKDPCPSITPNKDEVIARLRHDVEILQIHLKTTQSELHSARHAHRDMLNKWSNIDALLTRIGEL